MDADVLTLAVSSSLGLLGRRPVYGLGHPSHNLAVPRTEHAVRRWGWLTLLRIAYYSLVAAAAALAGSTALVVVAVLTALSAPSFQPIQLSVLYGYRSEWSSWQRVGAGSWRRWDWPRRRSSASPPASFAPSALAQNAVELGDGERVVARCLVAGAQSVEQQLQEAQ